MCVLIRKQPCFSCGSMPKAVHSSAFSVAKRDWALFGNIKLLLSIISVIYSCGPFQYVGTEHSRVPVVHLQHLQHSMG